jgi:hypothetical protein
MPQSPLKTNSAGLTQQAGVTLLNARYRQADHGPALIARLQHCRDNLSALRRANFTGSMLRHHTKVPNTWRSGSKQKPEKLIKPTQNQHQHFAKVLTCTFPLASKNNFRTDQTM